MCLACNDIGLLCSAPEGEIIYCEACVKGLTKALRKLGAQLEVDQAWLARKQAEGLSSEWAEALFGLELEEYERLRGLLQELERQDESYKLQPLHV